MKEVQHKGSAKSSSRLDAAPTPTKLLDTASPIADAAPCANAIVLCRAIRGLQKNTFRCVQMPSDLQCQLGLVEALLVLGFEPSQSCSGAPSQNNQATILSLSNCKRAGSIQMQEK